MFKLTIWAMLVLLGGCSHDPQHPDVQVYPDAQRGPAHKDLNPGDPALQHRCHVEPHRPECRHLGHL